MKRTRIALGMSLSLALLLAWTGCQSWPRQTLDSGAENGSQSEGCSKRSRIGMDAASVAAILGSPNIVTTDAERREVWVYDKVSSDRVDSSRSDHATLILIGTRSSGSSSSTTAAHAHHHHQVRRTEFGSRLCVQLHTVLSWAPLPLRSEGAGEHSLHASLRWGCCARAFAQTRPEAFFELTPESQAHKAAQTRYFETADDIELLSASAAVLQDIGFQVSESAHQVGYLRATKERSARERGQSIARFSSSCSRWVAT